MPNGDNQQMTATIKGNPEHFDDMLANLGLVPRPGLQTALGMVPQAVQEQPMVQPADFGTAPRSTLGKIGHALGVVGEVAGSALVPHVMPWVPGTEQFKERRAEEQAGLGKETAETHLREAQAWDLMHPEQKATKETEPQWVPIPGTTFQQERHTGQTKPLEGVTVPEKTQPTSLSAQEGRAVDELVGAQNPATGKPYTRVEAVKEVRDSLKTAAAGKPVQGNMNGNPAWGVWDEAGNQWVSDDPSRTPLHGFVPGKSTGLGAYAMVRLLTEAYRYDPRLLTMLPEMFKNMGIPMPAGMEVSGVPIGQPMSPSGAVPIGTAQPSAPTGSTRSRAQFALSGVLQELPGIKAQIADLKGQLGPVQGRWNEFMAGRVGADDPKFSGLRTSLKNIATAWMRLHANSETAREEFEAVLARSKTAADLNANLDAIGNQAQNYYDQELGYGERGAGKKSAKPSTEELMNRLVQKYGGK